MGKYDDIINLPHHVSKKHSQMPIADRAAQFAPDARKQGGHYEKKTEYVKRIDPVKEYIIMKDDTIIRFHYIKELQGEIFNKVLSF